jgi:hypothetical protein
MDFIFVYFRFPGKQRVVISKYWGFTSLTPEEYKQMEQDGLLIERVTDTN